MAKPTETRAPKSMKSFIRQLEEEYSEEIVRISKGPLKPHENECTSILYQLEKMGKWPMALFENCVTYSGKPWPGMVQFQQDSTFSKFAIACDMPSDKWTQANIFQELAKRAANPMKPTVISRAEAPVKHTVVTGKDLNLYDLPMYRKDSDDARPGQICGLAIGKHPETGRYNLSWHRHTVHGSTRSAARLQYRHLWEYLNLYKQLGYEEMPVAWVFGHHLLFMVAGATRFPYDIDEYEGIGGVMGEGLRLVPSETLGEDFLIPADAEVVVEGYLHTTDRDFNGPWTDYMRYYSPQTLEPVFRPTAFNFQDNPIFEEVWIGHELYQDVSVGITLTSQLKNRYPRLNVAYYCAPFTAILQFKPDHPGEARRLAHYALVVGGDFVKQVIVVDEDIDPFDLYDVWWAVSTRVDTDRNQMEIVHGLDANRHDPAPFSSVGHPVSTVGGFIIDATKPFGQPFPPIGKPEREVLERIRAEDYIDRRKIEQLGAGKLIISWHSKELGAK
ncbi:MAG: UbiD family decarboxylase [Chloroflexi bacterium]|nr:UbiD family decarboxylase [Chloroflexota bacterium]